MYHASHLIPHARIPALIDRVNKLAARASRKGLDGTMAITVPDVKPVIDRKTAYNWVTISGTAPKFDGWELVSRYDFERALDGKVVSFTNTVPGKEVPAEYRDLDTPRCDHCGTKRFRNNSFLLHKDGTYMVVGRNCISDFLGHVAPEQLMAVFAFIREIERSVNEEGEAGNGAQWPDHGLNQVISWGLSVTRKHGFVSRAAAMANSDAHVISTGSFVQYLLITPPEGSKPEAIRHWNEAVEANRPTEADLADVSRVIDHISTISGEYGDNLRKLVRLGFCPHDRVSLLVSAAWSLIRAEVAAKAKAEVVSEHVGTVGERRTMTLTVNRVMEFEGAYGTTRMYLMSDEAGRQVKWSTGGNPLKIGSTYVCKATIKAHADYKGTKQTVITRLAV